MTRPLWIERGRQVAGDLGDAVVPRVAVLADGPDVGEGQDVTGAQDLADPALVTPEDRQAACDVVGETGPGSDLQTIVAEHPDGRRVGPQPAPRLVDDHPDERLAGRARRPGVRRSRGPCRGARRAPPRRGRRRRARARSTAAATISGSGVRAGRPVAADEPAGRSSRRRWRPSPRSSGRPSTARPGRAFRRVPRGARARPDGPTARAVSGGRHRSRCRAGPWSRRRRVVDRLLSVGLHSASVAGPVSTAVRPRIRGLHIPVDDGPSPIGGERAALTMKPVRPAS